MLIVTTSKITGHPKGTDAVVAMRMETSAIASGASEIVAYGTGVQLDATG